MPIESVYCHVLGGQVTRITDLEGESVRIICTQYEEPTGDCRLKKAGRQGGPLSQLLERVADESLDTKSVGCHLRAR
jgi:hypothetical protein